jgi:ribonucleotide monophosphatase NagD (HAD superfamily)
MLEDVRALLIDLDGRRANHRGTRIRVRLRRTQPRLPPSDGGRRVDRAAEKNRYWRRTDRLSLDVGPFVAAIEFAAGRDAYVVSKPAKECFEQMLASVGVDASAATTGGHDIKSDISGALRAGLDAILIRTGKHREHRARESGIQATRVVDSIADVPPLLGT